MEWGEEGEEEEGGRRGRGRGGGRAAVAGTGTAAAVVAVVGMDPLLLRFHDPPREERFQTRGAELPCPAGSAAAGVEGWASGGLGAATGIPQCGKLPGGATTAF